MTEKKAPGAMALVQRQAEDEGLWFEATTAPEAYLQQELRKLHAAVEAEGPRISELEEQLEDLDVRYNDYIAANEPDDDPERGRYGR